MKYALCGRERLRLLRPLGEALVVQGLHWGDEIRSPAELAPPRTDVTEQEIEGALALMDTMAVEHLDDLGDAVTDQCLDHAAAPVGSRIMDTASPAPTPVALYRPWLRIGAVIAGCCSVLSCALLWALGSEYRVFAAGWAAFGLWLLVHGPRAAVRVDQEGVTHRSLSHTRAVGWCSIRAVVPGRQTSDESSPPARPTPDRHTTRPAPNPGEPDNRLAALPPDLIATTPTMLDSRMVRRKKEKKKRPDWGIPKGIVLLATPEGWRHSILTMEGGMLCGRLDVPINTDPQDARAAAARMVADLARDFHDTDVEVSWDPPQEPWSWTAQVTLAVGTEPAPPDTEG